MARLAGGSSGGSSGGSYSSGYNKTPLWKYVLSIVLILIIGYCIYRLVIK